MTDGILVDIPGGARIWYKTTGHGRPLLQIHGSAFGHKNFELLTPVSARNFQVIDFDLPGYGQSVGGPGHTGFDGLALLVRDLIRAIGYERVHVHGTSFGALIALVVAAKHPEVIDRLVLSCFLARYDQAARMMRATWKRAARESGMDAVADLTSVAGFARSFYDRPDTPQQLEAMRSAFLRTKPEAFIAGTETIERADLSSLAAQVQAPTLLLTGDEDNMTPFEPSPSGVGMREISKLLRSCKTAMLSQCGHYLVLEQPEQAGTVIAEFLSET